MVLDQVDIKSGESQPDILDKVKEVLGRWIDQSLEYGI